mmetsp:Transcript_47475/g.92710  ORF Transcript_47475/g.92710 Transcript_47475/m.92710 type:complete len:115 (-) Transcript_47475:590-934(-)
MVMTGDTGILFHSTVDPAPIHMATHKKAGTVDEPHFFFSTTSKKTWTHCCYTPVHPSNTKNEQRRTREEKPHRHRQSNPAAATHKEMEELFIDHWENNNKEIQSSEDAPAAEVD